jgi:predicted O-methyltransferase YrrM
VGEPSSRMPVVDVIIDGVRFRTGAFSHPADPDSFALQKSESMIDRLRDLIADYDRPRIFELGIYLGGSVALLALIADPTKLVSVDLVDERVERLDRFIEKRDLAERVRPHYGIDQSDRETLDRIVKEEFGDEPLDLVIDDASHDYEPTLASFEVLFPRLRPGGLYLIEDWVRFEKMAAAMRRTLADPDSPRRAQLLDAIAETDPIPPLSRLAVELVLLRSEGGHVVDLVTFDGHWIAARRGAASLDPDTFRVSDVLVNAFGTLSGR